MSKFENKHTWGVRTAARLRAVHASFADTSQEERSGYLTDEIEYALEEASAIPGETRHSLLEALEASFPVFGYDPVAPAVPVPVVTAAARKDLSLGAMVDRICENAPELTPVHRQKLAALLADGGNQSPENPVPKAVTDKLVFPASPAELEDCLKSLNQLWLEMGTAASAGQVLKLNRLIKMLGILTGGFRDIYRFMWPYWHEMAPRELNAQVFPEFPDGLEAAIESFVTGGEVNGAAFYQEIEKTKRILLSVLFGLRKGAEEYGKLYERKFSAEAIADTVALEESASDVSKVRELGRKCWDKYTQLTKHQTADAIHDAIVKSIAEAAFTRLKLSS